MLPSTPTAARLLALFVLSMLVSCGAKQHLDPAPDAGILQFMSLTSEQNAVFEAEFFRGFAGRHHVRTQYLTDAGGTVNSRLGLFQRFFRERSSKPDLLAIDVVWPSILAENMVDLKPILGEELKLFSPGVIANFTVSGRLIALPSYIDVGLLYYRADLLKKYGFSKPPATWDELEMMARLIQSGERREGNADFWGYVWQGGTFEGLTCNALEWQASAGARPLITPDRRVQVRDPAFLQTLARATRWIGAISPPGQYAYREPDSGNLWNAGNAAFLRHWASSYSKLSSIVADGKGLVGVAPLPAGPGGHFGTLGGQGIGISKYAANRKLAVAALLELTSEQNDLARVLRADSIPVRIANQNRIESKNHSPVHALSNELLRNLVLRPAGLTGTHYDDVSREYFTAINSVLRRRESPAQAMEGLELKLQNIMQTVDK